MSLPRYKPLRPKKPLARINPIGADTKRKMATRKKTKETIVLRARGRCELCGELQDPLEHHHCFGRHRTGVPDAILELPEMGLGLCTPCHRDVTSPSKPSHIAKARRAQWMALARLFTHSTPVEHGLDDDPMAVLREWVRRQEAA